MSLQEPKNTEKLVMGQKPTEREDEEYDMYLFWPSLNSRDVSSGPGDTASPLYGVCLLTTPTEFELRAKCTYATARFTSL
jgi:hypothetical protein